MVNQKHPPQMGAAQHRTRRHVSEVASILLPAVAKDAVALVEGGRGGRNKGRGHYHARRAPTAA
jgi:hypothetical protein